MLDDHTVFLFSGTHWDREWYLPFQKVRLMLADLLDGLVDFLRENPDFEVFHLDGQTVPVEDYLAVRPERRGAFLALARAGRIALGPWYCMPDEFLCSGESLVRNLEAGLELCGKYGVEPWPVGYLCDAFGHIAQMPQILAGFGIGFAVLGRGTNEHTTPAFFRWLAPDGSGADAFKLNDFYGYGHLKGIPMHRLEGEELEEAARRLEAFCEHEAGRTDLPILCLTDANDHQSFRENTGQLLDLLRRSYPRAAVRQGNLTELAELVRARSAGLPRRAGELREPGREEGYVAVIAHTPSARYDLKRSNDACQALLERTVQPLAAASRAVGGFDASEFIGEAYRHLLQNQAHDSICGCSVDQVHRDMAYRFDQCRLICEALVERLLPSGALAGSDALFLDLYNPLPCRKEGVFDAELDIPEGFGTVCRDLFYGESHVNFTLADGSGAEVPFFIRRIERNLPRRVYKKKLERVDRYHLCVRACLPPMASASLRVVPVGREVRARRFLRQRGAGLRADNGLLRLSVNADGTFDLEDLETGAHYRGFNRFYSQPEMGDGWFSSQPSGTALQFAGANVSVRCLGESALETAFAIGQDLVVPECLEWRGTLDERFGGVRPSCRTAAVRITTTVRLRAGSRALRMDVEVDNRAADHRVRMVVPACRSDEWQTDQPFCLVRRAAGRDESTGGWKEPDPFERPFSGVVCRRGADGAGMAFLSSGGLHEAAVPDARDPDVHITLFRSFRRTRDTGGEADGQLKGRLEFSAALLPLRPEDGCAEMMGELEALQAPPVSRTLAEPGEGGSLLELGGDGDVRVSVVRPAKCEREIEVRLVNYSDGARRASLRAGRDIERALRVSLGGEALEALPVAGGRAVEIALGAFRVETLRIKF